MKNLYGDFWRDLSGSESGSE